MEKPSKEKQAELRNRFVGSNADRLAKYREQTSRKSKHAHEGPPRALTSDDFRTTRPEED